MLSGSSQRNQTGTGCGVPRGETVVSQASFSSRNRRAARAPNSLLSSSMLRSLRTSPKPEKSGRVVAVRQLDRTGRVLQLALGGHDRLEGQIVAGAWNRDHRGSLEVGEARLHADTRLLQLAREHLRERDQEGLAGGVHGAARQLRPLPVAAEGEE